LAACHPPPPTLQGDSEGEFDDTIKSSAHYFPLWTGTSPLIVFQCIGRHAPAVCLNRPKRSNLYSKDINCQRLGHRRQRLGHRRPDICCGLPAPWDYTRNGQSILFCRFARQRLFSVKPTAHALWATAAA
jgi:hypothetical protein